MEASSDVGTAFSLAPSGLGFATVHEFHVPGGSRPGRAADSRSGRELLRRHDLRRGAPMGDFLPDGSGGSRDRPARLHGRRNPRPRLPDARRRRQLLRGHVLSRPAPGHFRERLVDPRFLRSLHFDSSGDAGLGLRALRNDQPRRRLQRRVGLPPRPGRHLHHASRFLALDRRREPLRRIGRGRATGTSTAPRTRAASSATASSFV